MGLFLPRKIHTASVRMMKIFAIAALVVATSALPSNVEEPVSATHRQAAEEAQSTITELLQAGKDEGACADLADATIKEVVDSVDNQQKILDALDTGADCPKEGQDAVDAATADLQTANKNKQDADAALAAAKTAMVKISPKTLSSLQKEDCGFVFNDPAYLSAKTTAENAQTAATAAAGAVESATKAVDDAKAAQQELIKACQCKVHKDYTAAWEAANKNNDADTQAYTKGKHMKCVLAGTSPASCSVGAVPAVTAITLAPGVGEAACPATPVPTPNPTPNPTPTPTAPIQYDLGTGITGCTGATTYAGLGSCNSGASEQHVADFWCKKGNFGGTATSWTTFKGTSGPMCYIQGSNPASVIDKTGSVKFMSATGAVDNASACRTLSALTSKSVQNRLHSNAEFQRRRAACSSAAVCRSDRQRRNFGFLGRTPRTPFGSYLILLIL